MKVSTKGRYALRMMVDLGMRAEGEYISLRDVTIRQEVSMKYMEQIVSLLTKSGLLQSVRGPQGGYRLARRPAEYTLDEILLATEGDLAPVSCLEKHPNPCPRAAFCTTLSFWTGLQQSILDYAHGYTLEDLVRQARQPQAEGPAAQAQI